MPQKKPPNPSLQDAIALHQQGKLAQAGAIYASILESEPNHPDCLNLLGILAAHARNYPLALALIERAIAAFPGDESFHSNRGNVLRELGRIEPAVHSYDNAIAIKPDYAEAYYNRGVALQDLGRHAAAVASYDRAIALDGAYAQAYYNRGNALQVLGQAGAAIASYARALVLDPTHTEAYSNRGNALTSAGQFDAALADYDKALSIKPDCAETHYNRGIALKGLVRIDAAIASFTEAIRLRPDYADAQWNKSLALLLSGDLEQGWELYESRWQTAAFQAPRRAFKQPAWRGDQSLRGKTILLHHDQGLGDAIQFCRYATMVANLGARVILEVARSLAGLLGSVNGVAQVVAAGDPLPDFDYHCTLLSLPLAFRTRLSTVPAARAYLRGDTDKVSQWQARLGDAAQPRVGLVASGNPLHSNDLQRSIALADLLRELPRGFEYVLLQKELRDADRTVLAAHPAVRYFGTSLADFSDTAALCELMDVVISVDTSVAHLAAALGKDTWILLPQVPDWRWLLDRADSVWYPSVRLFRQTSAGGWAEVLRKASEDLAARYQRQ